MGHENFPEQKTKKQGRKKKIKRGTGSPRRQLKKTSTPTGTPSEGTIKKGRGETRNLWVGERRDYRVPARKCLPVEKRKV